MAVTPNSVVTVQTPKRGMVTIVNADSTNLKTVVTAGANGSKVTSLHATNFDSSDRVLQVFVTRSGSDYCIGATTVPDLSGTNNTDPTVDLMSETQIPGLPLDNDGQRYLLLESGDVLKVKSTTAVGVGIAVHVQANYGDF